MENIDFLKEYIDFLDEEFLNCDNPFGEEVIVAEIKRVQKIINERERGE